MKLFILFLSPEDSMDLTKLLTLFSSSLLEDNNFMFLDIVVIYNTGVLMVCQQPVLAVYLAIIT